MRLFASFSRLFLFPKSNDRLFCCCINHTKIENNISNADSVTFLFGQLIRERRSFSRPISRSRSLLSFVDFVFVAKRFLLKSLSTNYAVNQLQKKEGKGTASVFEGPIERGRSDFHLGRRAQKYHQKVGNGEN